MGSDLRVTVAVLVGAGVAAVGSQLEGGTVRGADTTLRGRATLLPASFGVLGAETVDRRARSVVAVIQSGKCVGGRPDRFHHADVRVDAHVFVVKAWMRRDETGEACAGVGLPPLSRRIDLPSPIGRRGVVSAAGPGGRSSVLVPPCGDAAARSLVPPFIYSGPACDEVASLFRGRPKQEWCFY